MSQQMMWPKLIVDFMLLQLVDSQGSVVGNCTETSKYSEAGDVDKEVRDCRWQENGMETSR